ncbi:hypothetical protein SUDANB58_02970 [Streptomyces sp. enrichment culture]|uniref:hypothetical protein n=1 Tax=Streptomyces sp. enrichment culture TaxID=1795815 RepID=UPI003F561FBC
MGIVTCAVVLPFAVASAGPVSETRPQARGSSAPSGGGADGKAPGAGPSRTPSRLGLGAATAVRCGPELTSPGGIEARTCLLVQRGRTWARTHHRNATGGPLRLALSLTGPGGRTVRTHCAVGEADGPGTCETPRERLRGKPAEYGAVAEFTAPGGGTAAGPLLRVGSNSPLKGGS